MNAKPTSRTGADKPRETAHLDEAQKRALDASAEQEHSDGKRREELANEAKNLDQIKRASE